MSITRKVTRPRRTPFSVWGHHFFEETISIIKRIVRGLKGAGLLLAALLLLGIALDANPFDPASWDRVLIFVGSIALGIIWYRATGRPWYSLIAALMVIAVPVAFDLGADVASNDVAIASSLANIPHHQTQYGLPLWGTAALVAIAIGLSIWGARIVFAELAGTQKPIENPHHGSAEIADRRTVKEYGVTQNGGLAIYLGQVVEDGNPHEAIFYPGPQHILTVGPTGSHKTIGQLLAVLSYYLGSVIAFDPKAQILACVGHIRRRLGALYVISPFGIKGIDTIKSCGFNPLRSLDPNSDHFVRHCTQIAEILVPVSPEDKQPHFAQSGRELVTAIIMYLVIAMGDKATLGHVRVALGGRRERVGATFKQDGSALKKGQPIELLKMLLDMQEIGGPVGEAIRAKSARFINTDSNENITIISTALTTTKWLDAPQMKVDLAKEGPPHFADLKRNRTTVLVCMSVNDMETYSDWLKIFVATAIRELEGPPGRHEVLLGLEEFPAVGALPQIRTLLAVARDWGVKGWVFVQSFIQLSKLYKEDWELFISQAGAISAFTGGQDNFTLDYLTRMAGGTTVRTPADHGKFLRRGKQRLELPGSVEGFHLAHEPLVRLDELRRFEQARTFTFCKPMPHPCVTLCAPVWGTKFGRDVAPNPYPPRGPR